MKSFSIHPNNIRSWRKRQVRRRVGSTLIDVALGSMLMAVLLIPSIHLIGKFNSSNHRLVTRNAIIYEADQLMELSKVALAEPNNYDAAWAASTDNTQPIVVSDVPNLLGRIRAAADTSIPSASLLTVSVDVWQDSNRNGSLDAGEPFESLRTQLASP